MAGVGRGGFGDDWEKFNAISRGDMDWIEYTRAVFPFCVSCSPWFSALEWDFQISCIGLTPLGTLMWGFYIPLQFFCNWYIVQLAPASCQWIKWCSRDGLRQVQNIKERECVFWETEIKTEKKRKGSSLLTFNNLLWISFGLSVLLDYSKVFLHLLTPKEEILLFQYLRGKCSLQNNVFTIKEWYENSVICKYAYILLTSLWFIPARMFYLNRRHTKRNYSYIFISDVELHTLLYSTVPFLFLLTTLWVLFREEVPWAFSVLGCLDTQQVGAHNMFINDDHIYKISMHH